MCQCAIGWLGVCARVAREKESEADRDRDRERRGGDEGLTA